MHCLKDETIIDNNKHTNSKHNPPNSSKFWFQSVDKGMYPVPSKPSTFSVEIKGLVSTGMQKKKRQASGQPIIVKSWRHQHTHFNSSESTAREAKVYIRQRGRSIPVWSNKFTATTLP